MGVYEAPTNYSETGGEISSRACGVNCNWGFGVGVVIAMVGPLPGPT